MTNPLVHWLLLVFAAAYLAWRRRTSVALAAAMVGSAWLYICSTPIFVESLRQGLEGTHTTASATNLPHVGAILVLGGGGRELDLTSQPAHWQLANDVRLQNAARLYKAGVADIVLVSGRDDAPIIRGGLIQCGVPPEKIQIEDRSDTTHENVEFAASLLIPQGIHRVALVTSAAHMPRAQGALTKEDIMVEPAPATTGSTFLSPHPWLPRLGLYGEADRYLHEYVGLAFYRIRGWA